MIVNSVGLGPALRDAENVTLFVPTNDAFTRTFPSWADVVNPDLNSHAGHSAFERERLVEASAVRGLHSPKEFAGKRQSVQTVGGTVFDADGTVPGQIALSIQEQAPAGIGLGPGPAPSVARLGTPILARNGIIYPADAVIVRGG